MATLIQQEERVAVEAWGAIAGWQHIPSSPNIPKYCGPVPPPGFLYDLDDSTLIDYDAYWDAARLRDESAIEVREDQAQDLYYRSSQLPVCEISKLPRRTVPPKCIMLTSATKGRYLVATEAIKPGQTIAMDASLVVGVVDPFLHTQLLPDHAKLIKASHHYGNKNTTAATSDLLLQRCVTHMVKYATENVLNGSEILVQSSIIPTLAAFLLSHGDVEYAPAKGTTHSSSRAQLILDQLIGPEDTQGDLERMKKMVERGVGEQQTEHEVVGEEEGGENKKYYDLHHPYNDEHVTLARMAIRCFPARLLGFDPSAKPKTTTSSSTNSKAPIAASSPERLLMSKSDQAARIEELRTIPCGFFRRVGLHNPLRLSKLIAVMKCNSMGITVPDLPRRTGIFPFLRLVEHECRPNSSVTFLDCPATHALGETGLFSHDTKKEDRYGDEDPATKEKRNKLEELRKRRMYLAWNPSVVVLTAIRGIAVGEAISIAYIPTTYMTQPRRQHDLLERYHFSCTCRWCTKEPDLARAFQCPRCPKFTGAICPTADGSKYEEWECLQCGHHPAIEDISKMLDREQELSRIKADKYVGIAKLLGDDTLHYTHAVIFRKLDEWSERAWKEQEALICLEYIDAMKKSVARMFEPADPAKAQLNEFSGQVQHAVGHAHTSRFEYFSAYQQRLKAGQRFSHWCRLSGFMANVKSLVDLLDSH